MIELRDLDYNPSCATVSIYLPAFFHVLLPHCK